MQDRPDQSLQAVAKRRHAADQARAMIARQGYKHNSVWEDATERYVVGEITQDEYHELVIRKPAAK